MMMMRSLLFLVAVVVAAYAAEDSPPQQPTYNNLLSINNDLYTSLTEQSPTSLLLQQQQSSILHHSYPTLSIHIAFTEWTSQFNKSYSTNIEHALRKVTWVQNHLRIISHNTLGQHSYTLGHNEYSDLSNNEFQQLLHLGKYSPGVVTARGMSDGSVWGGGAFVKSERRNLRSETGEFNAINMDEEYEEIQLQQLEPNEDEEQPTTNVPEYKNWVEEGAVTSVKNQWFCGA